MVKDIYEKWLNHPNLDPSYKEVLEQMDEGQINDAFYTTCIRSARRMSALQNISAQTGKMR